MTPNTKQIIEAMALAIEKVLAEDAGGCFRSNDDTEGVCADHDCACVKLCILATRAAKLAELSLPISDARIEVAAQALYDDLYPPRETTIAAGLVRLGWETAHKETKDENRRLARVALEADRQCQREEIGQ